MSGMRLIPVVKVTLSITRKRAFRLTAGAGRL